MSAAFSTNVRRALRLSLFPGETISMIATARITNDHTARALGINDFLKPRDDPSLRRIFNRHAPRAPRWPPAFERNHIGNGPAVNPFCQGHIAGRKSAYAAPTSATQPGRYVAFAHPFRFPRILP